MDYGQLFSGILRQPDIQSTMEQAKQLAQTISAYQREQRTTPVIKALQHYANQYNSTTDEAARAAANAMANQIRSSFIAGGGSPMDLPMQNWGANPASGFQTPVGFESPITGYEGLGRKDTINFRRQTNLDSLERRKLEADLSGIDPFTGQKTWPRQYQEAALARSSSGGGGGYTSLDDKLTTRQNYSNELSGYVKKLDALHEARGSQTYADKFSTETGTMAPIQVAEADINRRRGELYAMGIDPDLLIDDLYKAEYGLSREDYWEQANRSIGNVTLKK